MDQPPLLTAIVTALTGYVAKEAKAYAEEVGQKAYEHCKQLAQKVWTQLSGNPKDEMVVDEFKISPEDWDKPLLRKLEQACQDNESLRTELRDLFEAFQHEQRAGGASHQLIANELHTEGGDVIVGTQIKQVPADPQEKAQQDARTRYFTRLYRFCQALPLEPLGGGEQELSLDEIYIKLNTTSTVERDAREKRGAGEEETRPLPALEAFAQHYRMVLLGKPGSGKSTFAKKIMAAYAGRAIGKESDLIDGLDAGLLPVWIPLRNLTAHLRGTPGNAADGLDEAELVRRVTDFLKDQLEKDGDEGFWQAMQRTLMAGESLLVFDGLDEVPEHARQQARQAVWALIKAWQPKRVLVTCRVRSYQKSAVFKNFKPFTLADLVRKQIEFFCQGWYEALLMPDLPKRFNYMNHPMVMVSWFEGLAYCRWLTERFQKGEVVTKHLEGPEGPSWKVTLPSEAEWEKAARGCLDKRRYPFEGEIGVNLANYRETGIGGTSAVGCFPGGASPYGCLDMAGNVWEWCRNTYSKYPFKRDDREDVTKNVGSLRVIRGGSWGNPAESCRCSCRNRDDPVSGVDDLGFRVVLVPSSLSPAR